MDSGHSQNPKKRGKFINIPGVIAILTLVVTLLSGTGSPVQAAGDRIDPAEPLLASGDLDTTFSVDGKLMTTLVGGQIAHARAVAIQSNGKIVAAGDSWPPAGDSDFAVARYNPGGGLDITFSADGKVVVNLGAIDEAYAVAIHQATGKIVVVGERCPSAIPCNSAVVRLTPAGGLDTTFNGTGKRFDDFGGNANGSRAAALYSDGRIVAAGNMYNMNTGNNDFAVSRYTAAGALDATFSGDGKQAIGFGPGKEDRLMGVAIQSDGKIVVGGYTCDTAWVNCNFALARLNVNGSLDTTFSGDGKQTTNFGANEYANAIALQADGKILLAGEKDAGALSYFALARYNTDGSLDTAFAGSGKKVTDFSTAWATDSARAIRVQADGKIVVCGVLSGASGYGFPVARYTSAGALDATFNGNGKTIVNFGQAAYCEALSIQPDGKYVFAGYSYNATIGKWALARILP